MRIAMTGRRPPRVVAGLALAALLPACTTAHSLRGADLPPGGVTWHPADLDHDPGPGPLAAASAISVTGGPSEVVVVPTSRLVAEGDLLAIHGPAGVQRVPLADALVHVEEPANGRTLALVAGICVAFLAVAAVASYEPGPYDIGGVDHL
ncbi:MAG: hypothetical protein KC549_19550 [Myxococcales bacterium]|nr:hypothetical protein [Myxococcales bacterium]